MMASENLENELIALESMYDKDFIRLSESSSFTLRLTSFPPSSDYECLLKYTYGIAYPNKAPKLVISNVKGLDNDEIKELSSRLYEKARNSVGSEMFLDIASVAEEYLTKKRESDNRNVNLFDGMTKRQNELDKLKHDELEREREGRVAESKARAMNDIKEIDKDFQSMSKTVPPKAPPTKGAPNPLQSKWYTGTGSDDSSDEAEEDKEKDLEDDSDAFTTTGLFRESSSGSSTVVAKSLSHYHSELIEIELLGKGGFGEVVKVENKLDRSFYAVKKIKCKGNIYKNKTIREVQTLSKLYHKHVVRYYTAWLEDDPSYTGGGGGDGDDSDEESSEGDDGGGEDDDDEFEDDDFDFFDYENSDEFHTSTNGRKSNFTPGGGKSTHKKSILYIQMEFCDGQTLREASDKTIEEKEAWRLLRQILEALEYTHSQNLIHRDLKPSNIFLTKSTGEGVLGDVKLGDFGLAVEKSKSNKGLSKVEEMQESQSLSALNSITGGVGTYYYRAPEQEKGGDYDSKADIFSLGIIFFEMCYPHINSAHERHKILTDLRDRILPVDHKLTPDMQRIILWMLSKNPEDRPSAVTLSNDRAISSNVADNLVRQKSLLLASHCDSDMSRQLLDNLFNNKTESKKKQMLFSKVLYTSKLRTVPTARMIRIQQLVTETLRTVFQRHSAIEINCPYMSSKSIVSGSEPSGEKSPQFLDRTGAVCELPSELLTPFAKFVAYNESIVRMKRYTISTVYRQDDPVSIIENVEGEFDIVWPCTATKRCVNAPVIAAELISVAHDICQTLPHLDGYRIFIGHVTILQIALEQFGVPEDKVHKTSRVMIDSLRRNLPWPEKIKLLMGNAKLSQMVASSLKPLLELPTDIVECVAQLKSIFEAKEANHLKVAGGKRNKVTKSLDTAKELLLEVDALVMHLRSLGISSSDIDFHLLLPGLKKTHHFDTGILFQIIQSSTADLSIASHSLALHDVFIEGGCYEKLILDYREMWRPDKKDSHMIAMGVRFNVDKITDKVFHATVAKEERERERERDRLWPQGGAADILITSLGVDDHMEEKLKVAGELKKDNVTVEFLAPKYAAINNIIDYCIQREIPLIALLPMNSKRQVKVIHAAVKSKIKEQLIDLSKLGSECHKFTGLVMNKSETLNVLHVRSKTETPSRNKSDLASASRSVSNSSALSTPGKPAYNLKDPVYLDRNSSGPNAKRGAKLVKNEKIMKSKIEKLASILPSNSDNIVTLVTDLDYATMRNAVTSYNVHGFSESLKQLEKQLEKDSSESGRGTRQALDRLLTALRDCRKSDTDVFVIIYSSTSDMSDMVSLSSSASI